MDNVNVIKRKKLKTRKNLDELRRKSRGETSKNEKKSEKSGVSNKISKFLTSQRLTLALNKKAVQSKTILRSKHKKVLETPKADETPYQSTRYINNNLSDVQVLEFNNSEKLTGKLTKADSNCENIASFSQSSNSSMNAAKSMAYILERNFSDEDELADALLQHISDYIIPNVHVEYTNNIDVPLKAVTENVTNELREEKIQRQIEKHSSPLHAMSDESENSVEYYFNEPSSGSYTNSVNNDSPALMVMDSIVKESPPFEFYPHPLNQ